MVVVGLLTAVAMGITIEVGWTPLRDRPVRRKWLWLAAFAVAIVPVGAMLTRLVGLPIQATMLAVWLPAIAIWLVSQLLSHRLPEGVIRTDPDAPAFERINAAGTALDVGDLDAATEALGTARAAARPRLAPYVDLWLRLVDEERQRRDGVRLSSRATREAMEMELHRLRTERARPRVTVTLLAVLAGVAFAVGVPAAFGRPIVVPPACESAQAVLTAAEAAPHATELEDPALSHLTLVDPGETAGIIVDTGLDLAAAARSRHDPNAQTELEAAGFVGGYHREWIVGGDGHQLGAEIFRFATPAGAAQFHRQATDYACRFANLAFVGPNGETGLQVRYSTGDPIVEQLGWVDGALRIVVSRTFAQPPADHGLIVTLAARAAERLAVSQPQGSPIIP